MKPDVYFPRSPVPIYADLLPFWLLEGFSRLADAFIPVFPEYFIFYPSTLCSMHTSWSGAPTC